MPWEPGLPPSTAAFHRLFASGFGGYLVNTVLVTAGITARPGGVRDPRGVRVRAAVVPGPGRLVLGVPVHADGAAGGHDDPAVPDDAEARAGRHLGRPDAADDARDAVRDLPAPAVLPHHPGRSRGRGPDRRRRPGPHAGVDRAAAVETDPGHRHHPRGGRQLEQLPLAADHHQQRGQAAALGRHRLVQGRDRRRLQRRDGRQPDRAGCRCWCSSSSSSASSSARSRSPGSSNFGGSDVSKAFPGGRS